MATCHHLVVESIDNWIHYSLHHHASWGESPDVYAAPSRTIGGIWHSGTWRVRASAVSVHCIAPVYSRRGAVFMVDAECPLGMCSGSWCGRTRRTEAPGAAGRLPRRSEAGTTTGPQHVRRVYASVSLRGDRNGTNLVERRCTCGVSVVYSWASRCS